MYKTPAVTIDVVLLTLHEDALKVALHKRSPAPFANELALPGGYVHVDEDASVLDTAFRVLREKTGLQPRYLEQLCVFSGPDRDPRGWSVSVSHVALIPYETLSQAGGGGVFHFYKVDDLPHLAFDHAAQVREAVARVRNKSVYSTLPCWLLPEEFTLTQLQHTYEQILGQSVKRGTFRSRLGIKVGDADVPLEGSTPILEATERVSGGSHRPARLYRVNHLSLFERAIW